MSTGLKVFFGFLAGLGVGFTAGFLFHKKSSDAEFEEISEEEFALLEKQADAEQKTAPNDIPFCKADVKSVQELPEDPDKMRLALQGKKSYVEADNEAKEKYSNIWKTIKDYSDIDNANDLPVESVEEGFDENFLEMLEEEEVEPGQVTPPIKIDLPEFYNERPEYDKITIDWYEEDNTFLDEKADVIADIRTYVGDLDIPKLFRELDSETEDPDVLFVRNEQYSSDYEIVRHHRSLKEDTGGSE